MPPPPWELQPTQFICMYSRWPWAMAMALFSYSFARGSPEARYDLVSALGCPLRSRCSRSQPARAAASASASARLVRQGEDIEPSSRLGLGGQVLDGIGEAQGGGRVAHVELGRDDRARPTADARHHGDILAAVGAAIADRLADDSAVELGLPEQFAAHRVERFEPAVHRPVEDQVAARRQRAGPKRQVLLELPHRLAPHGVPGGEHAAMAA